jgi:outer membrane protein OmpA-like peptidoglycan-associated protein
VPDADDLCPDAKEDGVCVYQGQEAIGTAWNGVCCFGNDGCPDRDADADGVPNASDACPGQAETWNEREDQDGCPDTAPVESDYVLTRAAVAREEAMLALLASGPRPCKPKRVIIEGSSIIILELIQFSTDEDYCLPQSYPILDAIAATLREHPEFVYIEIAGHADERASDAHSLVLSQRRAETVRKQLIKRGVASERLGARGYGEYCPLDERHQPDAWDKNRRVEFKVVVTDDGPTEVRRGCDAARERGILPLSPPSAPARDATSQDRHHHLKSFRDQGPGGSLEPAP